MIKMHLIFLVLVFPVPKIPIISFTHRDGGFLPVPLVSCLELEVFLRMISVKSCHPKLSLQNTSLAPPSINVNNVGNHNDISFCEPQVHVGISWDLLKLPSHRHTSTKSDTTEVGTIWQFHRLQTRPFVLLFLHFTSPHLKRADLPLGEVIHVYMC